MHDVTFLLHRPSFTCKSLLQASADFSTGLNSGQASRIVTLKILVDFSEPDLQKLSSSFKPSNI
jgi:hypothetical protein